MTQTKNFYFAGTNAKQLDSVEWKSGIMANFVICCLLLLVSITGVNMLNERPVIGKYIVLY